MLRHIRIIRFLERVADVVDGYPQGDPEDDVDE